MLIEFSVGNYRSFKEPVTLSMLAAKLRAGDKTVNTNNVFEAEGLRLLRSAAIYGANASGKSNLIRAMGFMRAFVLRSSKESQVGEPIQVEPFRLSTATRDEPSYFQIVFTLNGKRYRYGFELDGQRVHSEWLYHTAKRESRLFIREGDEYDISSIFKEGYGLDKRTRSNALFLSVVAQFNGPLAIAILDWFRDHFYVIIALPGWDELYSGFTIEHFQKDKGFSQQVANLVREADLGIAQLTIEALPPSALGLPDDMLAPLMQFAKAVERQLGEKETLKQEMQIFRVKTAHKVFDSEGQVADNTLFDLSENESRGTQKYFYLVGFLVEVLEQGKVLVIDELEAQLHPLITRTIIQLFNSPQTNPRNAQLIFATHDTGLLSKRFFRRDQIWFTEKDRYGATDLYSLAELQVRNDALFDKDYIAGKYGAIPFIGGLRALFEERAGGKNA